MSLFSSGSALPPPGSSGGPMQALPPGVLPSVQGVPPPLTDPADATIAVDTPVVQPPAMTELPPAATPGGVRHARLGTSDKTSPTMEVVKKLVIEAYGGNPPHDLNTNLSKYVTGFSSEPKKTSGGATVLDTYGRDPKFYQCDVTFKIEVKGPRDETITIDFTQTVQTRVKVPMAGDERAIKESQIKALFLIAGYRQSIEEPILHGQNQKIQGLMRKANLNIEVVRHQPNFAETLTWYGHYVRKLDEKPGKTAEKTLHVYKQSIIAVRVEGEEIDLYRDIRFKTKLSPETIWTTKVSCPVLDGRDDTLRKAYCAAISPNQESAAITQIRSLTLPEHAPPGKPTGMGLSLLEVQHIVARNCRHNLEDLDSMLPEKGLVAKVTDRASPLRATDTEVGALSLQTHIAEYRSLVAQLPLAETPMDKIRITMQAKAEMEILVRLHEKVNSKFEQANQQIATLECIDRNAQTSVDLEGDLTQDPTRERTVQIGSLTTTQHKTVKSTIESHKKFLEKHKLEDRVTDFNKTLKDQISQLRREFGKDAPGMQEAVQQVAVS